MIQEQNPPLPPFLKGGVTPSLPPFAKGGVGGFVEGIPHLVYTREKAEEVIACARRVIEKVEVSIVRSAHDE